MSALINIEAEQALLGAILVNNDVFPRIANAVEVADFYEPVHARIFEAAARRIQQDILASPVTLKAALENDEGLSALGGPAYLVRLAGAAISIFAAKDYAILIAEAAKRRRLAAVLDEARAAIEDPDRDVVAVMGGVEAHSLVEDSRGAADIIPFAKALTDAAIASHNARVGDGDRPMPSGVAALDDMLGGFYAGDFVILAGRPGMGKSSVALSFALHAARAGRGVAVASLEMTPSSLAMRAISEGSDRIGRGVAYADARRGHISENDDEVIFRTAQSMASLPIKIIPPSVRDLGGLYAAAKRCARQFEAAGKPMAALIIDYLQLIRSDARSRYEQITDISIALKQMAMQLGVPVIALSQLSRAVEQRDDKRPVMSDLRESGQLEQDADAILFCYRAEYYLRQERPEEDDADAMHAWHDAIGRSSGWMEIIVAKQRMGETGTVRVRYDERFNRLHGGAA